MSTGQQKRTRSQRVAAVELPPGRLSSLLERLRSGVVVARLLLASLLVVALLVITQGWLPPRDFYLKQIPQRDIAASTEFRQLDERATSEARSRAERFAEAVYDNDPLPLVQLKAKLKNEVTQLTGAETLEAADRELWNLYLPPRAEGTPTPTEEELQTQFERFQQAISSDDDQAEFARAVDAVFAPIERQGILDTQPTEANAEQILVRQSGKEKFEPVVAVRDVLIDNVRGDLSASLNQKLANLEVAQHIFARLRPAIPVTLKLNEEATREKKEACAAEVEPVYRTFERGTVIAEAGKPLSESEIEKLELCYEERLKGLGTGHRLARGTSVVWLYSGLIALCGLGVYRCDRHAITEMPRYVILLIFSLLTIVAMLLAHGQAWRLELVPLMLFGMTLAVAYRHQTAILLTAAVAAAAAIGTGQALTDALLLLAPAVCAIALLDSVRHRSRLLMVGVWSGLIAVATTLAIASLDSQPLWPSLQIAFATGLWAIVAGSLMTCLLPLVERVFHVQTDLSLIELGDPAHPLLQELVRRAPGTYNHSITVASLAESAADSIGARGLLVRVGAYFHDIGKMLKPGYFIENQGVGTNQHDALVPAMSTLVIIAHVKDGADLARQNKLPECIIDFILQHHGTTLVEYFYHQAKQKQDEAGEGEVEESSFRYPGPKPQTKEAGVLMMADAVESASRTLVEPTPARIESLVEEITRKRLDDGQFDECELTLEEVRKIGDSLVKSLTAVYHGRVKYPDQDTA